LYFDIVFKFEDEDKDIYCNATC